MPCVSSRFIRTYAAHPRVLVADLALPDGSGFTLISAVRALDPDLGIVVLTMRDDGEAIVQALEAGASAHLPKTADAEDILAAVRAAARAPRTFSRRASVEPWNARREAPQPAVAARDRGPTAARAGPVDRARRADADDGAVDRQDPRREDLRGSLASTIARVP